MFYYKRIKDGEVISVEAKSLDATSPNFVKATKAEYDAFIASLPSPVEPEPPRDPLAEIDGINAKLADYDTLKTRVEQLAKR